uniref:F-box domain-containing protein n=1 Tax=Leersia perrieri TaxID=77586 RepID=A0A0D9XQ97_9ORYZ
MPTREVGRSLPPSGGGGDEDRLGDLPDGILHHILGFLPAPESVRTCVLARRWRHLWKSATGLRIANLDGGDKLHDFVYHLLLLRGRAPLDTCELKFGGLFDFDYRDRPVILWFRHAVLCEVQVLRLQVSWYGAPLHLDGPPLASRHVVKLELIDVELAHSFLDFSSCPVLEHLEIARCDLSDAKNISSQSLKRLKIIKCDFSCNFRTRIRVPNLLSLCLQDCYYPTPLFEIMPLLVEAFIRVDVLSGDLITLYSDSEKCPHDDCDLCRSNTNCVFLQALLQAQNLVLITYDQEFVFKRDLMRCPTFSNLKTLLLIDCGYVAFDLHGVTGILGHSPVLEKLTLEFSSKVPGHEATNSRCVTSHNH